MKNRKIPMRSCVVTKEKLPKQELLRIVKTTDNLVVADVSGKINGRGAYIKKDIEVLDKAIKNKHMTFRESATLAKLGNVKRLLLTHFSPSLENPNLYLKNATSVFENTIIGQDRLELNLKFED